MARQGHRLFAAVLDFSSRHESRGERAARRAVVSGVRGRVLEIGVGVGANWPFLPPGVTYTGIDPDPFMIERARRHASEGGLTLELVQVGAENMPFEDAAFDTVFTTLTFCTVADVPRALAEVRRVLRPGGEFRFVSDIDGYVAWTLAHLLRAPDFDWSAERADDWRKPWPGYTMTRYGEKAAREGRRAAYLIFRRR